MNVALNRTRRIMIDNYPCFFTLCSSDTPYGPSGADATGVPAIKRQTDQASLLATLQAALDSQSYAGTLTVDKELKLLLALPVGNQPFYEEAFVPFSSHQKWSRLIRVLNNSLNSSPIFIDRL